MSIGTIIKIGIQLLRCLEIMHENGYIHNDLKADNILVGDHAYFNELKEEQVCKRLEQLRLDKIYLIDFGVATKYRLENGDHKPLTKTNRFRG